MQKINAGATHLLADDIGLSTLSFCLGNASVGSLVRIAVHLAHLGHLEDAAPALLRQPSAGRTFALLLNKASHHGFELTERLRKGRQLRKLRHRAPTGSPRSADPQSWGGLR